MVAPHPDDETLGCGGTLLRHVAHDEAVHWLIVSDVRPEFGFTEAAVQRRREEIQRVAAAYNFAAVHNLGFPPAGLDALPMKELVRSIGQAIAEISPTALYLPFRGDVHTDHAAVFDAVSSCTKWFRYPSVRRILCYETLSETDFGLDPARAFTPHSFVDITPYLERKIEIAAMYAGEMEEFPFPRSAEALKALAKVRGAACGCRAAESFMLLREIHR